MMTGLNVKDEANANQSSSKPILIITPNPPEVFINTLLPHNPTTPPNLPIISAPLAPLVPTVYARNVSVGVQPQVHIFKVIAEIIDACHFRVKINEDNECIPGDAPADIPSIRNLFFPSSEEIDEYEELLGGDIYKSLMQEIGADISERDRFKSSFFQYLYRPAFTRYNTSQYLDDDIADITYYIVKTKDPVREAMKGVLPGIVLFVDICKCVPGTLIRKGSYYKLVSTAMQSIEAQIILEVCSNLWKRYPKMYMCTLHDSIKCLPEDVDRVKEELVRTYAKYHVTPKFEVTHHTTPHHITTERTTSNSDVAVNIKDIVVRNHCGCGNVQPLTKETFK